MLRRQHAFWKAPWVRYGVAVAAVAAGFLLREALAAYVGEELPTYITFYPAVMLAALLTGLGPGLVATALTVVVVDYSIASPRTLFFRAHPAETAGVVLFSLMGAFLTVLTELYRRARERTELYERELALRKSQEALHEVAEQHRLALEAGKLGTWTYDFLTGEVLWDQRCRDLFGIEQGDRIDYSKAISLLHEADRQRVDRALQAALAPDSTGDYEEVYRVVWQDGSTRWLAAKGRVCFQGEGQQRRPQRFVGTAQDITERKQTEQALQQAHDQLEIRVRERTAELLRTNEQLRREIEVRHQTERELTETELRYRTVADFTYGWEYWETPECTLRYCSPSCERITGYSAQEFVADPSLLQQIVHPEDAGVWRKHREEALIAPEPRLVQFRIRAKEGAVRWVEHTCQPVLGDDKVFLGFRASNRDITDRKTEELQTQQLRDELAHVTRATTAGQLTASLAHELNQPLTAIHCNAQTAGQLLAGDPPNVAEVRETLGDIERDSERANGVVQRLRAFFNKKAQPRSVLQINEVIQDSLELLRSEFVLKGISTHVHLEPTLPEVLGNRIELQQVVLNLMVNAMDAMSEREPGQRHLQIVADSVGPKEICVSISDSGPGIRVHPISRLFEPFFTTKANGMGMGLAISQSLLEEHGGSLWAINNPDRGATFHLTLPIYTENPHEH